MVEKFKEKLLLANQICGNTYGIGSTEYIKANKELIAQLLFIEELKEVNMQILEELKKLNSSETSTTKKTTTTKK